MDLSQFIDFLTATNGSTTTPGVELLQYEDSGLGALIGNWFNSVTIGRKTPGFE